MAKYCAAIGKVKATAAAISGYANAHPLAGRGREGRPDAGVQAGLAGAGLPEHPGHGLRARPGRWSTTSTCPTARQLRQHTLSDGPYAITKYTPTKSFVLKRNPAWQASTDPLRKPGSTRSTSPRASLRERAAADRGGHGRPRVGHRAADPGHAAAPGQQGPAADHRPERPPTTSARHYLALNQYAGPMKNKLVRQAVATGRQQERDRQDPRRQGRSRPPSNQIILPGNVGYIPNFNPFPSNKGSGDPAKREGAAGQGRLPERAADQARCTRPATRPRAWPSRCSRA